MHHQALMWRGPCNFSEMEAVAWYSCRSWPLVWVTVPLIHYAVSCFNRYLAKVGTVDSSLVSRSRFKKNAPARGRFSFACSTLHPHFTATPSPRHATVRSCISVPPGRCSNASHSLRLRPRCGHRRRQFRWCRLRLGRRAVRSARLRAGTQGRPRRAPAHHRYRGERSDGGDLVGAHARTSGGPGRKRAPVCAEPAQRVAGRTGLLLPHHRYAEPDAL